MTTRVLSGWVGSVNTDDFYALTLSASAIETLTLAGVSGSTKLLVEDAAGDVIYSTYAGNTGDGSIVEPFAPGTYYVDVKYNGTNTPYTLVSTSNIPVDGTSATDSAGSSTATARNLGALSGSTQISDWVGNADKDDYYGFTLSASSIIDLTLSGVGSTTILYLRDAAGNYITNSYAYATSNGSLVDYLTAGTYYIDVEYDYGDTGYNLVAAAAAIPNAAGTTIANAPSLGVLSATAVTRSDYVGSVDTDDYYAFSVSTPSDVVARLSGVTSQTSLYILNVAGNTIGTYYYTSSDETVDILLPTGSYFFKVENTSSIGTGYTLTASAIAGTTQAGNSTSTALAIPATFTTTPFVDTVTVNPYYTGDYYKFTLTATTSVTLRTDVPFDVHSSYMALLNSTGSVLASSYGYSSGDALIYDTLGAGTYYVEVSTGSSGDVESYTFTASAGTPSVGSGATDTAGNTLAAARNLGALGAAQTIAEYVGTTDTIDYYKFTLASASTLNLTLLDPANSVDLQLQNAAGQQLTSIYPSPTYPGSLIDNLAAGTYYIEVYQSGNSNAGYSLTASATPVTTVTGGSIATAISFGTLTPAGGIVSGYVGSVEQVNDFQFTVAAASLVRLDVSSQDNNVDLKLLNAAGTSLTSAYVGENYDATIDYYLAPGSYYASVTDTDNSGTTYTLTANATPVTDNAGNTISTAQQVVTSAPADYNADAQSDLVLASDSGPIVIETQSNLTVTGGATISNPGPTWHVVSTADMDGNGSPDLLLQNDNGAIVDYIMSGSTVLGGFALTNPGSSWHVRGVGDFNGDGKGDIVLQNDSGLIVVDYTNGSSVIGGAIISNPGSAWTVEGVADFNGDGQPDLLLENSTNGQIVDFLMNGATPVAGYLLTTLPAGWAVVGTGNYNGDGRADIVVHNDNGSDVVLYTNGQSVTGSSAPIGNPGASWTGVVAGMDYNGDGSSDLLVENTSGSLVGFTLNSNDAVIGAASLGTPGVGWRAIGNTPMQFIDGTGATLAPLNGTVGADEFNLTSLGVAGLHSINGFDPSMDLVALSSSTFANYAAVQAAEQSYQGGTFIALPGASGVLIQGVTPSHLSSSDFVLR